MLIVPTKMNLSMSLSEMKVLERKIDHYLVVLVRKSSSALRLN